MQDLKGRPHAFHQKLGCQIIGVVSDVSGRDKRDILMGKRIE